MKYSKLLFPMMLLVASGAAFAATDEGTTNMSFDELDHDGDGVISRDEAEATPGLDESFDALDANADGVLDESEVGVGGPNWDEAPESGPAADGEAEPGSEAESEADSETDY